jgi:hypothetical protein
VGRTGTSSTLTNNPSPSQEVSTLTCNGPRIITFRDSFASRWFQRIAAWTLAVTINSLSDTPAGRRGRRIAVPENSAAQIWKESNTRQMSRSLPCTPTENMSSVGHGMGEANIFQAKSSRIIMESLAILGTGQSMATTSVAPTSGFKGGPQCRTSTSRFSKQGKATAPETQVARVPLL